MKKKKTKFRAAIYFLLFLAVLFAGFVAGGKFILAGVLEAAIGVPVKVGKFHLDFFSSEVGIYGLKIKNPKGFSEPTLASVPEIFLHIDVPSLFQNRVHVQEIRLNLDEITVERNASGAVNLMEIGAVKSTRRQGVPSSPAEGPAAPAPSGPPGPSTQPAKPPSIQIDTVILNLGRARYVDPAGTRVFPIEIRNATLRNVTDPAEITRQIVFKTLQRVGLNALTQELEQYGLNWDGQFSSASEQLKQAWSDLRGKFKF